MVISLVIAIVVILSLVFIVRYRVKAVIKEVVRRETNGVYDLEFSKISINILAGKVKLRAVDFKPANGNADKKDYRITIGHLYLSLASWNQLLFHRRLFVDSLQLIEPAISMVQRPAQKNDRAFTSLQELFKSLKDISEIFKVHMLEITNGKISITGRTNEAPVLINNIDFRVENFGQQQRGNTHLRYADNVMLRIARQHWVFPSGQIIQFRNLSFSGNKQAFLLDSCSITMAPDNRGRRTSLYADQLLFRTNEIASVFEKSELNIDTLLCKSPVLSYAIPGNTKTDTVNDLNESIRQLPANINIKFINIENGQLHLISSDNKRTYRSEKANLKVYRLHIDHDPVANIRTGSIDLKLHEISFATRDSLYLLTVNEFSLDSNNLFCRNAYLKPSSKAKGNLAGIDLPSFTLFDISLNELLEKRLKAQIAVVEMPRFFFVPAEVKKRAVEAGIPVDKFYSTLKELAQLIDVRWLTIKDGQLGYHSGRSRLSMNDIDVEVNLVDFLRSADPEATKRSIHALNIGRLNLSRENTRVEMKDFFINGGQEVGKLRSLQVQVAAGIQLNAANLYWERFSWDDFVKNKSIHIDTLNIPTLSFLAGRPDDPPVVNKVGLPPFSINKLHIGKSVIDLKTGSNIAVRSNITSIASHELATYGNVVTWQSLQVGANNLFIKQDDKQVAIQQLQVAVPGNSQMQHLEYRDEVNRATIPEIKFQLRVHNTSLKELEFPFFTLYQPQIMISRSPAGHRPVKENKELLFMPVRIGELNIINGYVNYQQKDDPLHVAACFDVNIQQAAIVSMNDQVATLTGLLNVQWNDAKLVKRVQHGLFEIGNGSGQVTGYPLSVNFKNDNASIKNMVNYVSVTGGRILYTDSTTTASVSKITGNGKEGAFALQDVAIKPRHTLETFLKTSLWQKDYLTFHSSTITCKGINYQELLQDRALVIRSVLLQNPDLSTFRNKNIPFQHGVEKLMPTKLLAGIKVPVQIDSVQIQDASIDVHEVSVITKREGIVPIKKLNALFRNITSMPQEKDSLLLDASAQVLDYKIRTFRYAESYGDSLSRFRMEYGIAPMQLSHVTAVSNPLSAIAVTRGQADTLYARVSGNKYAAFGEINFYYHNLRVRLLNKEDTLKKSLFLNIESLLANGLIKSKNQDQDQIFFVRDRERFVFNYWVKTLFSGLVTSAGVKRNSKYKKMYNEAEEKYSLPAATLK